MKKITTSLLIIAMLIASIQIASAAASLTIGTVSYDSTVVKDETVTITSSIEASGVSGTITVTVTLVDNSGGFTITNAQKTLTFSSSTTQSVQWTATAKTAGTYSNPFTITASGSDGGTASPVTSSTAVTIQERPVLELTLSQNKTTVSAGDSVRLNYTVTNLASAGGANATGVIANLTLPNGWTNVTGALSSSLDTIAAGGASKSGYWIVSADSPSSSNTLTVNLTSTLPGGITTKTYSISGPSTTGDSGGGGGGGGGGGAAAGEPYENIAVKEVLYVLNLNPNVQATRSFSKNHPIIELNFAYASPANEVAITIEKLYNLSSYANGTAPPGVIYEHVNIWVDVANQNYLSNSTVKFAVNKTWITANSIDMDTVALYRYKDSKWSKLETSKTGENASLIYYIAKVPGFSPFAITGEKTGAATATPTPTATQTATPVKTPTATETATATPTKSSPGFELLSVIFAIAMAIYAMGRNW